jgi:hypothetical protein
MTNPKSSPKERRIALRRPAKGNVKIWCYKGTLDLGQNIGVRLLDVSETGVRLLVITALVKDQAVLVILEGQGHMRPTKTPGVVVWCVPSEDGTFAIGVRLDKYLKYRDFNNLT